jgi:GTP-binding protein HflX
VSLVGYTNAGKSTLFNQMTDAAVLVEDRLFATLDSTVRQLDLPDGFRALMSDTVGFVRRLPHEVIEAFRSTLEEAADADLLVHVVDASDPDPDGQIDAVRTVLDQIDAGDIPELIVFNKTDITDPNIVDRLVTGHDGSVAVSALTGDDIDLVATAIAEDLEKSTVTMRLLIPYDRGEVVAALHDAGNVLDESYGEHGTELTVRVPEEIADGFAEFAS